MTPHSLGESVCLNITEMLNNTERKRQREGWEAESYISSQEMCKKSMFYNILLL